VVSLALICSFSRMRSHLGLEGEVKPDTVPEETVLAVAEVLRRSSSLRVSEDGKQVSGVEFCSYIYFWWWISLYFVEVVYVLISLLGM
jgi:hypothetical protein